MLIKENIYSLLKNDVYLDEKMSGLFYPTKTQSENEFPYILFKETWSIPENNFCKYNFDIELLTKSESELDEIWEYLKNLISKPFWDIKMIYLDSIKNEYSNEEDVYKKIFKIIIINN